MTKTWLLNRYSFAFALQDTTNTGLVTFKRIAPSLVKNTANQVDLVAERKIQQAITQARKEVKRIVTKIIC